MYVYDSNVNAFFLILNIYVFVKRVGLSPVYNFECLPSYGFGFKRSEVLPRERLTIFEHAIQY